MLFRILVGCVATMWLGAMSISAGAAEPPPTAWTAELMLKVKLIGEPALSPDGRRVAFVAATPAIDGEKSEWISQIHLAGSDGASALQLTRGERSSTSPAWSPDGEWIAFLSSRTTAARANLWRIRIDGGEAEPLTDEKGGITEFAYSPDGSQLAFVMPEPKSEAEERAEREKRDAYAVHEHHRRARLYVVPVAADAAGKRPVRRLTAGDLHVGDTVGVLLASRHFDWSPDSTKIAFAHQPTPLVDDWRRSDISLVDVASAKVTPLAASAAAETQPVFSPDGRLIACAVSDDPPHWAFAFRVQLVTPAGEIVRRLAESHDQRPMLVGWSQDARSVLFSETQRTIQRLSALPIDGSKPVDLSPKDRMVSTPVVSARRTHVAYVSETTESAPEISVTPSGQFQPTQASRVQDIPRLPTGKTEVMTWKSSDGREIEGLLTLPPDHRTGTRLPFLVIVHGGPMGVFTQLSTLGMVRPQYPIAVFAARGYAVLRVNPRGSSGYGKEFRYANYGDWGGGDYRDIMTGVDDIIKRGIADSTKLAFEGWSYGGYMTAWVVSQTSRFKAARMGAGLSDLQSMYGTTDIPGYIGTFFSGIPTQKTLDFYRARSAITFVDNVTTPLLILHGGSDQRVPTGQSMEYFRALKDRGKTVELVFYPREGHGLGEYYHQMDKMQREYDWITKYTLGNSKPVP